MELRRLFKDKIVCGDGAFGTYYASKYNTEELPEMANLKNPERVVEIHREYIEAGANFIRTNTFAAYSENLEDKAQIKQLRQAAVKLAKQAVYEAKKSINSPVIIAGDIGPAPFELGENETEIYVEFARDLIEAGVQALIFETFSNMDEIEDALEIIKEEYPELFIFVSFAVNQYGSSTTGRNAGRLLEQAINNKNVDAAGLNCSMGPAHMISLFERLSFNTDKIITAFPNAGYPKLVRDRIIYSDNAAYFADTMKAVYNLGIDLVGGCCGTKPEHIKCLSETIGNLEKAKREPYPKVNPENKVVRNTAFFANKKTGEKIIAVELNPPLDIKDEGLVKSAEYLKEKGVDCLTFPDSPSGRTRVDAVLMAKKIMDKTGLFVMPHIACRDKNAIAMRSQFMGAYLNGIYNFLLVTGDPVPVSERGKIKGVFNFDSTGLMSIASDLNNEHFSECPIVYGGAINQTRKYLEVEIKRVTKKMERGASFFMTQPVFTKEDADRLRQIKQETGARILVGIMPLISKRNALFMKNEISGVNVSQEIVDMFPENASKEEAELVGVKVAKKAMESTEDFADGYYFSFPFNRVYLLEKLIL